MGKSIIHKWLGRVVYHLTCSRIVCTLDKCHSLLTTATHHIWRFLSSCVLRIWTNVDISYEAFFRSQPSSCLYSTRTSGSECKLQSGGVGSVILLSFQRLTARKSGGLYPRPSFRNQDHLQLSKSAQRGHSGGDSRRELVCHH